MAGVRAFMRRIAREAHRGRGCLSANSAMELLPGDAEVDRVVTRHQRLTKDMLVGALQAAERAGEIPPGRPADVLGRYLFAVMEGLWELGRTSEDVGTLYDVVEATLRAVY
jgi:TetR/AcrR family transcriptional repressor of nem operon